MFFVYFGCSFLLGYVDSSVFDQRQTGDFNVQVDVKDVQIYALMKGDKEEYVDYDYAYDYSELTIKPQNRTTPKPFNGTRISTQRTTAASNNTIQFVTTGTQDITTAAINGEESTSIKSSDNLYSTTIKSVLEDVTEVNSVMNSTVIKKLTSSINNCKRGFAVNQKGECQLKFNNTGNALLKLVKLSHKLKPRRENKSNNNP